MRVNPQVHLRAVAQPLSGLHGRNAIQPLVSRTQALRMLGNAVVPQQAALAWRILTSAFGLAVPAATSPQTRGPIRPSAAPAASLTNGESHCDA